MRIQPPDGYWPASLAHLANPFVLDTDEEVVVGEITGGPRPELHGVHMRYTALVPTRQVSRVLRTPGGIGHDVECNGPHPSVGPTGGYRPRFWIRGSQRSANFTSLVHSWLNHNKIVLLLDDGFLMCYGLVPRTLLDGSISWDDPGRPVYDVVRILPLSTYDVTAGYTTARVTIRREYLEDYLSLTGRVAVAVFWEERYCTDPEIDRLLGSTKVASYKLPGREIWIRRSGIDRLGQHVAQVSGCALLLATGGRPVSDHRERKLQWPDREQPVSKDQNNFGTFEQVYVRDEVLLAYENRTDDFEIHPESGSVSHNGWWSASYCSRVSRNFIGFELRKLYEGATTDALMHFNRFAASKDVAERDAAKYGKRHVGERASDVVAAFLRLTSTLERVSDVLGLYISQGDIGKLTTADVKYYGWWTLGSLRPLGRVIPLTLSEESFMDRCTTLFKICELLQPLPMRQMLLRIGLKQDKIERFASVRLLGALCQLSTIARQRGLFLQPDAGTICDEWIPTVILPEMRALFALLGLRNVDSHVAGPKATATIAEGLAAFGIDRNSCTSGWGTALDLIYDQVAAAFDSIARLLEGTLAS